jgi:hypothetical protein
VDQHVDQAAQASVAGVEAKATTATIDRRAKHAPHDKNQSYGSRALTSASSPSAKTAELLCAKAISSL